ncbi:flagellar alpha dynein [Microcoleus sp. BROC3]|uniref:flagellar alpha dynein n=1 Tax=Microcoleus sp. BROC3 TaxID=3055323 RepID=UPI002FD2AC65
MKAANKQLEEWDKELNQLHERNGDLGLEVQNLKEELATVKRSRDEIKKSPPIAISVELPEPADLLNQLKTRRKKSTATLADIEAILEMIEKSCDDTSREN